MKIFKDERKSQEMHAVQDVDPEDVKTVIKKIIKIIGDLRK
jgi:hypothetical protein